MKMTLRQRLPKLSTAIAALLVVFCCSVAAACPNCSQGLADQPGGGDMVAGYFWSILFMMAMPFTIFTGIGGYMYFEVRKARKRQEKSDTVEK
jgi:heme/copper-type cytochrome/quinol oxidase subunit 2